VSVCVVDLKIIIDNLYYKSVVCTYIRELGADGQIIPPYTSVRDGATIPFFVPSSHILVNDFNRKIMIP